MKEEITDQWVEQRLIESGKNMAEYTSALIAEQKRNGTYQRNLDKLVAHYEMVFAERKRSKSTLPNS